MASASEFLDRLLGRQKQREKYVYGPVGEEDTELYNEILNYGKAHPELQEQFPDFDSLAEHYMKNVRGKMMKEKIAPKRMIVKMEDEDGFPKETPVVAEKTVIEVKPVSTADFLDRLKK